MRAILVNKSYRGESRISPYIFHLLLRYTQHVPIRLPTQYLTLHKNVLLVAALIIIGIFTIFRFSFLSSSPPGFFVDESSIGLNAVRILETGRDEHGIPFPLYFRAFGDFKNPIYVYSVVPLVRILGPTQQAVRLASALWVWAAIGIFFLLMQRAKSGFFIIAISLMIAVSNPWMVQLSRVAFELASFPFFLFLAALCLFPLLQEKVSQKKKIWLALGFGISLGILFYTYTAARVLSPILLGMALLLVLWKYRWRGIQVSLIMLLAWGICFVPLFLSDSFQNGALMARYQVVGLSNQTRGIGDFVSTAASQYFDHFTLKFLRGGGDENLRHIGAPFGIFLTSSLPFIVTGIFHSVWKQRSLFALWCLGGLLISPIPAALTTQSPHVLRSIGLLVFCLIFVWYGVSAWAQSRTMSWRILGSVGVWLILIETLRFLVFSTTTLPEKSGPWFNADSVQAIETALQHPTGPYAFSHNLYPGSEATVEFLAEKWSVELTPQNSQFFYPESGFTPVTGVIVGDYDSCPQLIRSAYGFPRVLEQSGVCVIWYEP